MAHTQGPWAVSNYYAGKASISGKDWGGFATVVTKLDGDESESVEGLANARLIAAAPDLLATLETAYKHFLQHMERDWFDDDDQDVMQQMFDAITKAREIPAK